MGDSVSFNKWLKSKIIIPTIPLGVITLTIGVLNFCGITFNYVISYIGFLKDLDEEKYNWSWVFLFLNFSFALFVVLVSANKFKKTNENTDESILEKEKNYFQYLSLKKGQLFSVSNSFDDWINFKRGVNKTINQFTWFWVLTWLFYALNYLSRLDFFGLIEIDHNEIKEILSNLLNNLGSLMVVFLFMTLTISTAKRKWFSWGRFIFLIGGLGVIELILIKNCIDYDGLFVIFSALFGAIALGLFVTSIDSKFANIPIWVTTSLLFYTAIQVFYVATITGIIPNLNPKVVSAIFGAALIFKIILFWVVTWLLRTNRLLFVVFEEGSLNYQREINYDNFNEIISTEDSKLL